MPLSVTGIKAPAMLAVLKQFTQGRVIGIVKHDHSGKWRNETKNRNRQEMAVKDSTFPPSYSHDATTQK